MELKVKKLHPNAKLPTKNHSRDACFDLYCLGSVVLDPLAVRICYTGIAIEIPEGYAGFIWDRSGMGARGVHRLAGVIDSTYRGEIRVVLVNLNSPYQDATYTIKDGDRIAQLFINKVEDFDIKEVKELSDTERGVKGFGSSGR